MGLATTAYHESRDNPAWRDLQGPHTRTCTLCGGPYTAAQACWGCWRRFESAPLPVMRAGDVPAMMVFHEYGPRPVEPGDVRVGQAWLYSFDGEQSTWIVRAVRETELGPEAELERWYPHQDPRPTRDVYARALLEDADWSFMRNAYDEEARAALAKAAPAPKEEKSAGVPAGTPAVGSRWVRKDPGKVGLFKRDPEVWPVTVVKVSDGYVHYHYEGDADPLRRPLVQFTEWLRPEDEAAQSASTALGDLDPAEWEPVPEQPAAMELPEGEHVVLIKNPNFAIEHHPPGELVKVTREHARARLATRGQPPHAAQGPPQGGDAGTGKAARR